MAIVVIFGAPGSGKGTISDLLKKDFGFVVLSTGELLREEAKTNPEIKSVIDAGSFVSDNVVEEILFKKIESLKNRNIILDGYPRNIEQAKRLDEFQKPDSIVFLHIDHIEAKKRILERGKTSGREDDKDEEVIKKRMETFSQETAPIIAYYYNRKVNVINAGRPLKEVYDDIKNLFT